MIGVKIRLKKIEVKRYIHHFVIFYIRQFDVRRYLIGLNSNKRSSFLHSLSELALN